MNGAANAAPFGGGAAAAVRQRGRTLFSVSVGPVQQGSGGGGGVSCREGEEGSAAPAPQKRGPTPAWVQRPLPVTPVQSQAPRPLPRVAPQPLQPALVAANSGGGGYPVLPPPPLLAATLSAADDTQPFHEPPPPQPPQQQQQQHHRTRPSAPEPASCVSAIVAPVPSPAAAAAGSGGGEPAFSAAAATVAVAESVAADEGSTRVGEKRRRRDGSPPPTRPLPLATASAASGAALPPGATKRTMFTVGTAPVPASNHKTPPPPPPPPAAEEEEEAAENEADLARELDDHRRHEEDIAFTQRGGAVVANLAAAPGLAPVDTLLGDDASSGSTSGGASGLGDSAGSRTTSPQPQTPRSRLAFANPATEVVAAAAAAVSSFYGLSPLARRIFSSRGVKTLYDWQHTLLTRDDVCSGRSLVYSLPTSGGKTLVAEVLLLRCVTLRNKSALFVLPYVSIAEEKTAELAKFAHALGFNVEGFYGVQGKFPVTKSKSVFVCTIEKANSLWNQLCEEGRCGEIGAIVVDELHMLGEMRRGATLEMLLCKVLNFNQCAGSLGGAGQPPPPPPPPPIQIIGMSATIPNLNCIAEWLGAGCYEADFRPVPLRQFCVTSDGQVHEDGDRPVRILSATSEFQCLLELCAELEPEHSALVFCASRQQTVDTARNLARAFAARDAQPSTAGAALAPARGRNVSREIGRELRGVAQINEPVLAEAMEWGVAFHHAGLLAEERNLIERAFRARQISVLCCTSTLAAGVNLPARRVIFKTPYIGRDFLTKSRYSQMCGRAGRAGLDTHGEAFLLLWKKHDVAPGRALMKSSVEPTKSVMLLEHSVFLKCVTEAIASGSCRTVSDVQRWGASLLCKFIDAALPEKGPAAAAAAEASGAAETVLNGTAPPLPPLVLTSAAQVCEQMPLIIDHALEELSRSGLICITDPPQQRAEGPTTCGAAAGSEKPSPFIQRHPPAAAIAMTPFGSSGVRSCFAIEEALMIRTELQELQEGGLIMSDDLHICYFLTPVREIGDCNWAIYEQLLARMSDTRQRIATRLGVDEGFVAQRAMGLPGPPPTHVASAAFRQTLFTTRRFFVALMLSDLLNEVPVAVVEEKFRTSRGQIQSLMKSAAMFSSSITSFCNAMEWYSLEAVLSSFVKRLGYGVKPDLVPLMEIKGVQAPRARALWTAGFRDVESIATAIPEELVRRVKEENAKDSKAALFFTLRSAMSVIKQATLLLNAKAREKLVEHEELSMCVVAPSQQQHPPQLTPRPRLGPTLWKPPSS